MRLDEIPVQFVVVDKDGNVQGVDSMSGGYPYSAGYVGNIRFWREYSEAKHYCDVINYGGKGYSVKRVRIQEDR